MMFHVNADNFCSVRFTLTKFLCKPSRDNLSIFLGGEGREGRQRPPGPPQPDGRESTPTSASFCASPILITREKPSILVPSP